MEPDKGRIGILVAVLRSGLFPQGAGKLCVLDGEGKPAGYCCLGVATEIAIRLGGLSVEIQDHLYGAPARAYAGRGEYWPQEVMDWYGIDSEDPELFAGDPDEGIESASASALNDGGHTFTEIADLFEEKYLRGEGNAGAQDDRS